MDWIFEVKTLISSGVNKLKGKQIVVRAKLFYNYQGWSLSLGGGELGLVFKVYERTIWFSVVVGTK